MLSWLRELGLWDGKGVCTLMELVSHGQNFREALQRARVLLAVDGHDQAVDAPVLQELDRVHWRPPR